jgi:hypothetical protein
MVVASASPARGIQESERGQAETPQRTIAGTTVVGQVDRLTIQSALEVLPRRPARIVIIDDAAAPSGAHRARDLDGFVPVGSSVIYLRRQSPTLRAAEYEGGAYLLVLATVIWHEMAHAEGVDETGARQQEEDLWESFVRAGRVESAVGLSYLAELKRRR